MREKDVHNLIEQQDPETKQRLWKRISAQLDLTPQPETQARTQVKPRLKGWHWATIAVALVCVTLSIVLPLTLKENGTRYCDMTQYTTEDLEQTLREYSLANNKGFLYVDWYDIADERKTNYSYINNNKNDVVFFEEFFINGETGSTLTLSITNNKTKVDRFELYNKVDEEFVVKGRTIKLNQQMFQTLAIFEYKGNIYYLQLDVGNAKDELTEIIKSMLK